MEGEILTEITKPENLEMLMSGGGGVVLILVVVCYFLYKDSKAKDKVHEEDQNEYIKVITEKDELIEKLTQEIIEMRCEHD